MVSVDGERRRSKPLLLRPPANAADQRRRLAPPINAPISAAG